MRGERWGTENSKYGRRRRSTRNAAMSNCVVALLGSSSSHAVRELRTWPAAANRRLGDRRSVGNNDVTCSYPPHVPIIYLLLSPKQFGPSARNRMSARAKAASGREAYNQVSVRATNPKNI